MNKILLLIPLLFILGCQTIPQRIAEIDEAYKKGEITKYQSLQLKNEVYKGDNEGVVIFQQPNLARN